MKVLLDIINCTLCLIETRLRQIEKFCPKEIQRDLIMEVLSTIVNLGFKSRTRLFQETYNLIVRKLGRDPYKDQRIRLRELFKSLVCSADINEREAVYLLKLSAASNMLDVEMRSYKVSPEDVLIKLEKANVKFVPSLNDVICRLNRANTVVFALDNAGEHVIDIILARRLVLDGKSVILISREVPYEIDIICDELMEDLKALDLDGTMQVYSSSGPPILEALKMLNIFNNAVILSKGIANFEAYIDSILSLNRDTSFNVIFCLAAKCEVLSRFLSVDLGMPVVFTSDYLESIINKIGKFS